MSDDKKRPRMSVVSGTVIPNQTQRPWWGSWWMIALTGVAVGGAATGAVLITRAAYRRRARMLNEAPKSAPVQQPQVVVIRDDAKHPMTSRFEDEPRRASGSGDDDALRQRLDAQEKAIRGLKRKLAEMEDD